MKQNFHTQHCVCLTNAHLTLEVTLFPCATFSICAKVTFKVSQCR